MLVTTFCPMHERHNQAKNPLSCCICKNCAVRILKFDEVNMYRNKCLTCNSDITAKQLSDQMGIHFPEEREIIQVNEFVFHPIFKMSSTKPTKRIDISTTF